jgi:dihydroorotate dehydrogenase (fumarate)
MDIEVLFLGLNLKSPLVVGSGPFDTPETAKECAAAGAAMLVMHSLFEEQYAAERAAQYWSMEHGAGPDEYEAMQIDPANEQAFGLAPDDYYERLASLKKALTIPVVGSINGTSPGNWVIYAQQMEEAGADAIELNLYDPIMDTEISGAQIEERMLQVVKLVRRAVQVPLAVKLCPFYSSIAHLARQFDNLGIDGIVLFNRFYQPDFDIRGPEPKLGTYLNLSTSLELPMRLRWTAALYGRLRAGLAITGGVHTGEDVIKSVLAGADVVQVVSELIVHGPGQMGVIRTRMEEWMAQHKVESLESIRGLMSLQKVLNPEHYDRVNYVGILREGAQAALHK